MIAITGATGFIGRHLVQRLMKESVPFVALVRPDSVSEQAASSLMRFGVQCVPWDADEPPTGAVAKCGIKTLVHLAWVTQPGVYLESEENDLWVTRSLALIEGLLAAGLEHCVSTGTCIEYDPSAVEPCDEETTPIVPRSRYAQCKVELYRELVSRFKLNESTLSWVRVFHVYGEGEHPMRFVTSMAKTFLSGGVVDLKTPSSVRDFVDVRNVTGILALAIAERFDGVVNAGSGNGVTIRHAAESIAELCGRTRDSVRCSAAQADPTPNIVAGTKRMAALGAPPPIDYRIGFAQLIENLNQTL